MPRWMIWLGVLAVAGYLAFLAANTTVVAGGSDSSGYLNSALLLASGRLQTDLRVPAEFGGVSAVDRRHFEPAGFNHFPGNPHLAPVYPTGLPLHLAAAGRLLGWRAGPFLVQLLAACAAVYLCYRTARELGLDFPLAAAGAAMLAAFPVFIFTSIQTLSDTLATAWVLAALLCALRAHRARCGRERERVDQEGSNFGPLARGGDASWSAASGAALAISVLVRPTNLLLAPALLVLLGLDVRRLALFAAAGLPGAAWLVFYNHQLYGGALRSGYGNIYADFGLHYAGPTALHFARWLALFLPAVILVLPFAALASRATRRRELLALALATLPNISLYLFYGISHEDWSCLRFILPGLPALILAGLLGVEALARGPGSRWPRGFRPAAAVGLTLWAAANSAYWVNRLHVLYVPRYEQAYADAAREMHRHVPPNGIVVCSLYSGAVYYYTDLPVLNFDAIQAADFARYAALARGAGRPIYAVIFNVEEDTALRSRCPGTWTRVAGADNIGLWKLE